MTKHWPIPEFSPSASETFFTSNFKLWNIPCRRSTDSWTKTPCLSPLLSPFTIHFNSQHPMPIVLMLSQGRAIHASSPKLGQDPFRVVKLVSQLTSLSKAHLGNSSEDKGQSILEPPTPVSLLFTMSLPRGLCPYCFRPLFYTHTVWTACSPRLSS